MPTLIQFNGTITENAIKLYSDTYIAEESDSRGYPATRIYADLTAFVADAPTLGEGAAVDLTAEGCRLIHIGGSTYLAGGLGGAVYHAADGDHLRWNLGRWRDRPVNEHLTARKE